MILVPSTSVGAFHFKIFCSVSRAALQILKALKISGGQRHSHDRGHTGLFATDNKHV